MPVELASRGTDLLAVGFKLSDMVFIQHLAVEQQPTDQRALAVVDTAAGNETQQLFAFMLLQVGFDISLRLIRLMRHGGLRTSETVNVEVRSVRSERLEIATSLPFPPCQLHLHPCR